MEFWGEPGVAAIVRSTPTPRAHLAERYTARVRRPELPTTAIPRPTPTASHTGGQRPLIVPRTTRDEILTKLRAKREQGLPIWIA